MCPRLVETDFHPQDALAQECYLVKLCALIINQGIADHQHAFGQEGMGRQNIRDQRLFRCGGTAHRREIGC